MWHDVKLNNHLHATAYLFLGERALGIHWILTIKRRIVQKLHVKKNERERRIDMGWEMTKLTCNSHES